MGCSTRRSRLKTRMRILVAVRSEGLSRVIFHLLANVQGVDVVCSVADPKKLNANIKLYADVMAQVAKANNVPMPKIVFTTYANPLPKKGADCADINYLYGDQVGYLTSLLQDMNGVIKSTIKDLNKRYPGVAVTDIEKAYQAEDIDHRWCTNDPWAYGLSIYKVSEPSSFYSLAPFHPTPAGQRAIADAVIPTVANLFRAAYPVDTTSTTTPAPPGG